MAPGSALTQDGRQPLAVEAERGALRRQDAEFPQAVAVDLEHGQVQVGNGIPKLNPPVGPDYALTPTAKFLNSRAATIYGGSYEIQHNILARIILGA